MSVVTLRNIPFKPDTTYMEVPRCQTCRWWRPDQQDAPLEIAGVCAAASTVPLEKRDSAAVVSDGAQLVTLPDFGCVQWEAKSGGGVIEPVDGHNYRVTAEVPVLCCSGSLKPGEVWRVERQTSKNRLMVSHENARGGRNFHKVKRSTFRSNVREADPAIATIVDPAQPESAGEA